MEDFDWVLHKYGDGGVDVSPIADLYKTRSVCFGKSFRFARIHQNAIPTDGLWDVDRTDEQQIGATYPELEKIQKEWEQNRSRLFWKRFRSVPNFQQNAQKLRNIK